MNNCILLNRTVELRSNLDGQGMLIVLGEGSDRCEYELEDIAIVSWIFGLREPQSLDSIIQNGVDVLGYETEDISSIIFYLIEIKILVDANGLNIVSTFEQQWEQWGWRDALDFHRATRNLTWRHDYSNNPQIMTWYYNDKFMDHSVPKPILVKKKVLMSFSLPQLTERLFKTPFSSVLLNRRTTRKFSNKSMPLNDLSDVLGFSFQNLGRKEGKDYHLAHSYSLGDFFEAYVVVNNVENTEQGIYYYDKENHALSLLKPGNYSKELIEYSSKQSYLNNVSIAIYLTINWPKYIWKFRYSRAYRVALVELGGVAQNVLLCCSAINLKAFITPAIDEGKVIDLLGIYNNLIESPFYIIGVGSR